MANKLPRYSIAAILKLKKKIEEDDGVRDFLFTQPVGEDFISFVAAVHETLPKSKDIPLDTVFDSCRHLAGDEMTPSQVATLAWRLAGNLRRLTNGLPVLPWDGCHVVEWVPAQIIKSDFDVNRWGNQGTTLKLRVLAGSPCAEWVTAFWSAKYCRAVARHFGFSRWADGKFPFRDVRELVNMRLFIRVEPDSAEIKFNEIAVTDGFQSWNRGYLRKRAREKFRCPKNFPKSLPCFRCAIGQDRCPAAVHPTTYFKLHCQRCDNVVWFEKETDECCVDCTSKNKLRDFKRQL